MTAIKSPKANDRTVEIERRKAIYGMLREWRDRLSERSAAWDLETVKHLVVLNAAGFAGVGTIMAGSRSLEAWVGQATLLGYGFGVALAVLNMYLASVSFMHMTEEIDRRITDIFRLDKPVETTLDRPAAGRRINIAGQVCGGASAGFSIASTLLIGLHLAR